MSNIVKLLSIIFKYYYQYTAVIDVKMGKITA